MSLSVRSLLVVLASASLAACGGGGGQAPPAATVAKAPAPAPAPAAATAPADPMGASAPAAVTISDAARKEAEDIYTLRCTPCHGTAGKGDGVAAATLTPKPRDYSDKAWQAATTDEHIEKTIVMGGAAMGLSPLMVANPDLATKPEVVAALRLKIRSFSAP